MNWQDCRGARWVGHWLGIGSYAKVRPGGIVLTWNDLQQFQLIVSRGDNRRKAHREKD
jgi:hypothetical protein